MAAFHTKWKAPDENASNKIAGKAFQAALKSRECFFFFFFFFSFGDSCFVCMKKKQWNRECSRGFVALERNLTFSTLKEQQREYKLLAKIKFLRWTMHLIKPSMRRLSVLFDSFDEKWEGKIPKTATFLFFSFSILAIISLRIQK